MATRKAFLGSSPLVSGDQPAHPPTARGFDRTCLGWLASRLAGAACELRLWDGSGVTCSEGAPVATVTIRDRKTLWKLLWQPDLGFGEGYMNGTIQLDGDLAVLMESVNRALSSRRVASARASRAATAPSSRLASAKTHVRHHYDLGNEFFEWWLDEAMVYTCAYYETPAMTLEAAQEAKLDYVCRKLNLRPGDRVIEAGSGWGALAIHMGRRYGARVRSYNISSEQVAYARDRAAAQGLSDQVTFIDGDFRSIDGECDVFVSIGMLEHIGLDQYAALGGIIDRVLHPDHGRGLLHFIGRSRRMEVSAWTRRYIFPGTYAPVLSEVTGRVLEPWNLSVLDVENLRLHYAATLRDWRARFEQASDRVSRMFDDRFVRMWRLYLSGAEASFRTGHSQLFQVTFARPVETAGRLTRQDLYSSARRP